MKAYVLYDDDNIDGFYGSDKIIDTVIMVEDCEDFNEKLKKYLCNNFCGMFPYTMGMYEYKVVNRSIKIEYDIKSKPISVFFIVKNKANSTSKDISYYLEIKQLNIFK
jgi:hypothetical protein